METLCSNCRRVTRVEGGFCRFCGVNLDPSLGVRLRDYQAPEDREAISNLDMATMLMPIVQHVTGPAQRNLEAKLLRSNVPLERVPNVFKCAERCARILGLDRFPKLYVVGHRAANAFAFGSDEKPSIALTLGLLRMLRREDELRVILGHEMGHIKSKHLSYHMLAETLAKGTSFLGFSILGRDLLSLPLRMLLLAWYRNSELTADRASLITSGDVDAVKSTIAVTLVSKLPPDEAKAALKRGEDGLLQHLGELLRTHPSARGRIKQVEEFYRSAKYRKIALELWDKRLMLSQVLCCRFCGEPNLNNEPLCPSCGRCQV